LDSEVIVHQSYSQRTNVAIYIKGIGNISPQKTWDDETLLAQTIDHKGNRLVCVEPEYTRWLDAKQIRRMSRILKMGDGIITGTGYGCLDDTGIFLSKMIESNELTLNPTPFIQSTHNTIGSTIALLQQCQGYNQTYVQGAFSFESSLLDAILLLKENPSQSLLVGGVDEITDISHTILNRFGIFRDNTQSTLNLFRTPGNGTINGEGATYFVVSGDAGEHDIACVEDVAMFYKAGKNELQSGIERLLTDNNLRVSDIDFVLSGRSGDAGLDKSLTDVTDTFTSSSLGLFKHLCGEYPVASAFALWLGARILRDHHIPDVVVYKDTGKQLKNILVINQYFGTHHSVMLMKSCRAML
jgi:3-oxoacyl-[acyl-carrier-protein] synthase II